MDATELEETKSEIAAKFGTKYDHPESEPDPECELERERESTCEQKQDSLGLPHRHLSRWYLTHKDDKEPPPSRKQINTSASTTSSSTTSPTQANSTSTSTPPLSFKRRYALPENKQFNQNYILHGYMVPPQSDNNSDSNHNNNHEKECKLEEIPVAIHNLKQWNIHTSFTYRGIWVETESGYYYLQDPCTTPVPRDTYEIPATTATNKTTFTASLSSSNRHLAQDPYLPSQAIVHLPLRAKIGLLSNIIDVFRECRNDKDDGNGATTTTNYFYAPLHAKKTVEEIYTKLCYNQNMIAKYLIKETADDNNGNDNGNDETVNDEPFDFKLLKASSATAEFIKDHILNLHVTLSNDSVFMKSLTQYITPATAMNEAWRDNEYKSSAEKAEKRSKRQIWGGILPNITPKDITPNRLMELTSTDNILTRQHNHNSEKLLKEASDTYNKILNGDINDTFVLTETSSFSKDSMIEAIGTLADHLKPSPTEDDKQSCDYSKFSVDETKMDAFMETYMLNKGVLSLELMFLVVKAISQSSDKVMKALFKRKGDESTKAGGTILFKFWLAYVVSVMEKRRHRFSRNKPKEGEDCTEELIAIAVIDLITKFQVIKNMKQVTTLKNKYGVDWFSSVEQMLKFGIAHKVSGIINVCEKALIRLEGIKKGIAPQPIKLTDTTKSSSASTATSDKDTPLTASKSEHKAEEVVDPNRMRLAKLIEESKKKRIREQSKEIASNNSSSISTKIQQLGGLPSSSRNNDIHTSSLDAQNSAEKSTKTEAQNPSKSSLDGRVSRKDVDTIRGLPTNNKHELNSASITRIGSAGDDRISSKDVDGFRDLTMNSWQSNNNNDAKPLPTRTINRGGDDRKSVDEDRISSKGVDGRRDLPINSWKNNNNNYESKSSPSRTTSRGGDDRKSVDEDRISSKGVDGLRDMPINSWKSNNNYESRSASSRSIDRGGYDRISSKDENGLRDLPINSLKKNNRYESKSAPTRSIGREVDDRKIFDEGRISNKGIDGLHGLPISSWKMSNNYESESDSWKQQSDSYSTANGSYRNDPVSGINQSQTCNKRARDDINLRSSDKRRKIENQSHSIAPVTATNGGSIGRGRGRTTPAWMSRQDSNSAGMTSDTNKSNSNHIQNQCQGIDRGADQEIGSAGRGRGRDRTAPAWMTRQENSSLNDTSDTNRGNSSYPQAQGHVASRDRDMGSVGQGRGRGRTKPAWMTR